MIEKLNLFWARFAFIVVLTCLSIALGFWIPVYSGAQGFIDLFILATSLGGLFEVSALQRERTQREGL